jgi:hypothetical protein
MNSWELAEQLVRVGNLNESALEARPWVQAIENMLPALKRAVESNDRQRVLMMVEAFKGYLDEIKRKTSTDVYAGR